MILLLMLLRAIEQTQAQSVDVNLDINNVDSNLNQVVLPGADYSVNQFVDGSVSDSVQTVCPRGIYFLQGM